MTLSKSNQGAEHSQRLLQQEIAYLQSGSQQQSVWGSAPLKLAGDSARWLRHGLFGLTGLENLYTRLSHTANTSIYRLLAPYTEAMMNITEVFAVRCVVATLSMPVFLWIGLVSLMDGLVEREKRKWGGGNERGFLYHALKPWMPPLLMLPWFIYLSLPWSLHPNWIFVPAAALIGLVTYLTTSNFKKYL